MFFETYSWKSNIKNIKLILKSINFARSFMPLTWYNMLKNQIHSYQFPIFLDAINIHWFLRSQSVLVDFTYTNPTVI